MNIDFGIIIVTRTFKLLFLLFLFSPAMGDGLHLRVKADFVLSSGESNSVPAKTGYMQLSVF